MDIETIKNNVDEISSEASSIRDEETIEDMLASLEELAEHLDNVVDEMDDDTEYQEIMVHIDEIKHIFTETLDGIYDAEDEDEDDLDY